MMDRRTFLFGVIGASVAAATGTAAAVAAPAAAAPPLVMVSMPHSLLQCRMTPAEYQQFMDKIREMLAARRHAPWRIIRVDEGIDPYTQEPFRVVDVVVRDP